MSGGLRIMLLPVALLILLPGRIAAQSSQRLGDQMGQRAGQRAVVGKVYAADGQVISNASVGIQNNAGSPYVYLQTDKKGEFQTEYNMMDESYGGQHFTLTLTISKKGYEVFHRVVEFEPRQTLANVIFTLRTIRAEDPSLLSQAELTDGLFSRLKQLGPADGISDKDVKEFSRGTQEFLERKHWDRAIPILLKVVRNNPSCLGCRTLLALAKLNWGDLDGARTELGDSINALIADRRLARPEPLLAYGVLATWDHDYSKAMPYLAEAAQYAPRDALVLQELGRVQCLNMNWEAGSESLKKALAAGAGPEARFMLAEALILAGTGDQAEAELNCYLDGRDVKKMPLRVRALSARIESREKSQAAVVAAVAKARARGEEPIDYLHDPPKNLPDFEPATDQQALGDILAAVGKNVSQFLVGLPNISATERVGQNELKPQGKLISDRKNEYRYLCLVETGPWGPFVDEYRTDSAGNKALQTGLGEGLMLTRGFVSAPLVFHPSYQNGGTFRLLGRQRVNGRDTFMIAFAEDPARSRLYGSFKNSTETISTYAQGIAWIDVESYQIIRIVSDLLTPLPRIKLEKLSTDINFNVVHFDRLAQTFWLPGEVTVTVGWNGKILRNKHAYSGFQVFNVESDQKLGDLANKSVNLSPGTKREGSALPVGSQATKH